MILYYSCVNSFPRSCQATAVDIETQNCPPLKSSVNSTTLKTMNHTPTRTSLLYFKCAFVFLCVTTACGVRLGKTTNTLQTKTAEGQEKAQYYSVCRYLKKTKFRRDKIKCYVRRGTSSRGKSKGFRETLLDIVKQEGGKCCGMTHLVMKEGELQQKTNCDSDEPWCKSKTVNKIAKFGDAGLSKFTPNVYEYCHYYGNRENVKRKNEERIKKKKKPVNEVNIDDIPTCEISLPEKTYDLEWSDDAYIRRDSKLSVFFNAGSKRSKNNVYFSHPKVKIIGSKDITTIKQIGDGGFFTFVKLHSVSLKNLRFLNDRPYFTEGKLTAAKLLNEDEDCTEKYKACITAGLNSKKCREIDPSKISAQIKDDNFIRHFAKELCRMLLPADEKSFSACKSETIERIKLYAEKGEGKWLKENEEKGLKITALHWLTQKKCLTDGTKLNIDVQTSFKSPDDMNLDSKKYGYLNKVTGIQMFDIKRGKWKTKWGKFASAIKYKSDGSFALTPMPERSTCCKRRFTVSRGDHLKSEWDNGNNKVRVKGLTIGKHITVSEAYSFFGRIDLPIALLHDSYGQRFFDKGTDKETKISMTGLRFKKVHYIDLTNIWMHSAAGMAIYIAGDSRAEDEKAVRHTIKLQNVSLIPKKGIRSGLSVNSDSVHIGAWKGKVEILDSKFIGGGDDGLNVRSNYREIIRLEENGNGKYTVMVSGGTHAEYKPTTYPPDGYYQGTKLLLIDRSNMMPYGYAELETDLSKNCNDICKLHLNFKGFDQPNTKSIEVGDLLDIAIKPYVTVKNTLYKDLRARGINVKTRSLIVENCRFKNLLGPGIMVSQDSCHDMESGVSALGTDNKLVTAVMDFKHNKLTDCNLLPMMSMVYKQPKLEERKYYPAIGVSSQTERDVVCYRQTQQNNCKNAKYDNGENGRCKWVEWKEMPFGRCLPSASRCYSPNLEQKALFSITESNNRFSDTLSRGRNRVPIGITGAQTVKRAHKKGKQRGFCWSGVFDSKMSQRMCPSQICLNGEFLKHDQVVVQQ